MAIGSVYPDLSGNGRGVGPILPEIDQFANVQADTVSLDDPTALITVDRNTVDVPPLADSEIHLVGADGLAVRITMYGFVGSPNISGLYARGTGATPSGALASDFLLTLQAFGYGDTDYSSTSRIRVNFTAAENWTDTAQGTRITFLTTPLGSTVTGIAFQINADKSYVVRGTRYFTQAAPTALTTSATLTAAQVIGGMLTANQGAGAVAAYQMPLGTDLEAVMFLGVAANDTFEFSLINISTVAAEDVSITANTGVTLVGNMNVASNDSATSPSVGRFRVRRTAANTYVVYRVG